MRVDLSGRTAVVTGSTAGIGYAIARGLAGSGASVVVNGRTTERVEAALGRLREELPEIDAHGVVADLGAADGCRRLVQRVPSVDILVNNVGVFEPKPFVDIPDEDWQRLFDVNVMSGVRLSRAYLPAMIAATWGRIVFISSESAVQIPPEMVHYGTTKTAQLAISRGLAETAAGSGVTVNAVLPGPTRSEGAGVFLEKLAAEQGKSLADVEAAFLAEHRPSSLLGRFATVEEVAAMVIYVCSEQAAATSGAALRVDGGIVRSII